MVNYIKLIEGIIKMADINNILQYINEYGYIFLAIVVFLEYLNLPGLPAGIIMPAAGILVKYDGLNLATVTNSKGENVEFTILEEDKIWVNVDEVTGKSREAAKLEAHNRFIDIQIPLLQEETFGWEERGRLAMEEEEGYQVQNDILFYQERPALYFTLPVGDFVIFFPEDAHAPCIGNGKMKKMVVKVKL